MDVPGKRTRKRTVIIKIRIGHTLLLVSDKYNIKYFYPVRNPDQYGTFAEHHQ